MLEFVVTCLVIATIVVLFRQRRITKLERELARLRQTMAEDFANRKSHTQRIETDLSVLQAAHGTIAGLERDLRDLKLRLAALSDGSALARGDGLRSSTAASEAAPVDLAGPVITTTPVIESAPALRAAPVVEAATVVETPVVETAPLFEAAPAAPARIVIEAAPVMEAAPVVGAARAMQEEAFASAAAILAPAPLDQPAPSLATKPAPEATASGVLRLPSAEMRIEAKPRFIPGMLPEPVQTETSAAAAALPPTPVPTPVPAPQGDAASTAATGEAPLIATANGSATPAPSPRLDEAARALAAGLADAARARAEAAPSASSASASAASASGALDSTQTLAAAPAALAAAAAAAATVPSADAPAAVPAAARAATVVAAAASQAPAPSSSPAKPAPARRRSFEEFFGENLALKAGVVFLVIGVVLALGYTFMAFGALGKVLMGYGLGGAMLAGGVFAERREKYRAFGRGIIAGSWGVLYFITFALHFVPAARVIDSPALAVMLLLAAGAAAVAFSLRYKNEWTTTGAFLLIYLSLAMAAWKTDAAFNLVSTATAAAAMSFLVWRLGWDRLLALGLTANWVTLAFWLLPQVRLAGGAERLSLPALLASIIVGWTAFQGAVVGHRKSIPRREVWQVAGYLGNMAGAFGLLMACLHTLAPRGMWIGAALFGIVYIACAAVLRATARRVLYLVSGTIAIAALAVVGPMRAGLGNDWTLVSRLVGIEVLLATGVFLRERYFRLIAYGAFAFTFLQIAIFKTGPALATLDGVLHLRLILLALAAALAYINVPLLRVPWRAALTARELPLVPYALSVSGAFLTLLLIILEVPSPWRLCAFALAALAHAAVDRRFRLADFAIEGALFAGAVLFAIPEVLRLSLPTLHARPASLLHLVVFAIPAMTLATSYLLGRLRPAFQAAATDKDAAMAEEGRDVAAIGYSAIATLLLAIAVAAEATARWSGIAFGVLTLAYVLSAARLRARELLYEALALTLCGVTGIIIATATESGKPVTFVRVASTLAALALIYGAHGLMRALITTDETRAASRTWRWLAVAFGGVATFTLTLAAWSLLPDAWVAPGLALAMLVYAWLSARWDRLDLHIEGLGLALLSIIAVLLYNTTAHSAAPLWGLATTMALFVVSYPVLRWTRRPCERIARLRYPSAVAFATLGTCLAAGLANLGLPLPFIAPALLFLALLELSLSLRLRTSELFFLAIGLTTLTLLLLLQQVQLIDGVVHRVPVRLVTVIVDAAVLYACYLLLRAAKDPRPDTIAACRPATAVTYSVVGLVALVAGIVADVPATWVAPGLAAIFAVKIAAATRWRLAELVYEALGAAALTLWAVLRSWELQGRFVDAPRSTISVALSVALLLVGQSLLARQLQKQSAESRPFALDSWRTFEFVAGLLLTLPTVLLAWRIKVEALAYDKNLIVAVAWAALAAIFLEVARARRSRIWLLHGHGLVVAAVTHLFLVNFLQEGELPLPVIGGAVSLRLVTVVPVFLILAYAYATWETIGAGIALSPRFSILRRAYQYALVAVLATLLLYDLQRAWVVVGWAVLGAVVTARGRQRSDPHWLACAAILAAMTLGRALATNLYFRDEAAGTRINLYALPGALVIMLAGYLLVRQGELTGKLQLATTTRLGRILRWQRFAWLVALVSVITAFIWVEAEGTILTVWYGLECLLLVVLGLLVRERAARLFGLGMLTACVLKLFIYDLRDLSGMPRILSFIVLGVVLIAVSLAYTRFKERLRELL